MSEQGGRYNRSFEGLIGAMIVIVLAVVGFFVFRGLFSDPQELTLEAKDYCADVGQLQAGGLEPVYPVALPDGWKVTDVRFDRERQPPPFVLNLFTGDDEFVGVRQADEDVDDLLETAGLEQPDESDPLTGVGELADTWDGWTGEDGDRAYSTAVGDQHVIVFGRVSADVLERLVVELTQAPLTPSCSSATDSPTESPAG